MRARDAAMSDTSSSWLTKFNQRAADVVVHHRYYQNEAHHLAVPGPLIVLELSTYYHFFCRHLSLYQSTPSTHTTASSSTKMAEQRKAVIKNADMSEPMQQDAVDIASVALSKYNIEKASWKHSAAAGQYSSLCLAESHTNISFSVCDFRMSPHTSRRNSTRNTVQLGAFRHGRRTS